MNPRQDEIKRTIEYWAGLLGIDPNWASAIAMTESSLGEHRISPTNCRGIFQMSVIAMDDLRQLMGSPGDDVTEILCGLLFLRLLQKRWGTIEEATLHYCDPADRGFYLDRIKGYMREFKEQSAPEAPPVAEIKPAKSWWAKLWG